MSEERSRLTRISGKSQGRLVLVSICVLIVYGLIFGGGYGASIDEPKHAKYGRQILEIYHGQRPIDQTTVDPLEHGPFYSFISFIAGRWVNAVRPGWTPTDGRHYIYYLSFVMATVFMALLASRYTRPEVAWVTAGLFFSQPILLGHAFINPKDIPFMAFFLGALTAGVYALGPPPAAADHPPSLDDARSKPALDAKQGTRWMRILVGWTLASATILGILWLWEGMLPFLQSTLTDAYHGQAFWPIQSLFHAIATDAYKTPLDLYQAKLSAAFALVRTGTTIILGASAFIGWSVAAWVKVRPLVFSNWAYVMAACAGLLLGFDTSIRAAAPLAAGPLVLLYVRYAGSWKKALSLVIVLLLAAVPACVATWPFLWQDAVQRYLQSILTLSHFPWHGLILFQGKLLSEGQQPWYFIPYLMLLQFTLPVIALALLGLGTAWRWLKNAQQRIEIACLVVTLSLPVIVSLVPGTIVYNNFRQLLFATPGIFLMAALGLELAFRWLKDTRWRVALAALAVLPGIVGIVRLYPYEYIYYNALAGIGGNTYTRFESDYWCTSYREAVSWINENAPQAASVEVGNAGIIAQAQPFARSDLRLMRMEETEASHPPAYAVICDGKGGQRHILQNRPTLMTVERGGATLAEIKDLRPAP
jgi:hypothetical protein